MKKHLLIYGKVQNVGFRQWLYIKATEKNIHGWVKNKITGEVEVLLIGNDEKVNNIIEQCKAGPLSAKVTQIKIENFQKEFHRKSFDILNSS